MDCSTLPCPSLTPRACSTHVHWVSDAIQPSHPLSPSPPAFNRSQYQGLFHRVNFLQRPLQRLFGASASVLPMNFQAWFPLGWTGWISLQSKGLAKVFSSTTVGKYQFFGAQPSLWSNSHIVHDYQKSHIFDYMDLCWQSNVSAF